MEQYLNELKARTRASRKAILRTLKYHGVDTSPEGLAAAAKAFGRRYTVSATVRAQTEQLLKKLFDTQPLPMASSPQEATHHHNFLCTALGLLTEPINPPDGPVVPPKLVAVHPDEVLRYEVRDLVYSRLATLLLEDKTPTVKDTYTQLIERLNGHERRIQDLEQRLLGRAERPSGTSQEG